MSGVSVDSADTLTELVGSKDSKEYTHGRESSEVQYSLGLVKSETAVVKIQVGDKCMTKRVALLSYEYLKVEWILSVSLVRDKDNDIIITAQHIAVDSAQESVQRF